MTEKKKLAAVDKQGHSLVTRQISVTYKWPDGHGGYEKRRSVAERTFYDKPYGKNRALEQSKLREAMRRQWQSLSPKEQLDELDKRLGAGVGAGKQRAKISARMAKTNDIQKAINVQANVDMARVPKKNYQKPAKHDSSHHKGRQHGLGPKDRAVLGKAANHE